MDISILLYIIGFIPITLGFVLSNSDVDPWEYVKLKQLPPVRVSGRQGGSVVLLCSASGVPTPSLAWYKDGAPITVEDDIPMAGMGETVARLTLPCLSQDQAGTYECRATAGEEVASAKTVLEVEEQEEERRRSCDSRSPTVGRWLSTLPSITLPDLG